MCCYLKPNHSQQPNTDNWRTPLKHAKQKPNFVAIMHIWFLNEHSSERYNKEYIQKHAHTHPKRERERESGKQQKAITIDYKWCA